MIFGAFLFSSYFAQCCFMGVDNGIFHVTMEMQANEKEMPAMPGKVQDHPQAAFRDKSAAQYLEISRSTFRALGNL
ncbi:hypothetical protein ACSSZE_17795 [Acidithiobacillus caldus]